MQLRANIGYSARSASTSFAIVSIALMMVAQAPNPASASGFFFPQLGSRATSLGTAFVSRADDYSSIFHNPAGLAFQDDRGMIGSANLYYIDFEYTRVRDGEQQPTVSNENNFLPSPFLGLGSGGEGRGLGHGIAMYSSFGGTSEWPDGGPQRYSVQTMGLITLDVTYAVGYPLTDNLAVGLGVSGVYALIDSTRIVDFNDFTGREATEDPEAEMRVQVDGTDWGYGGHLSFLYRGEPISAGLTYRAPVDLEITGDLQATVPPLFQIVFGEKLDYGTNLPVTLPQYVRGGVMFDVGALTSVSTELTWVDWSVFDANDIRFTSRTAIVEGMSIPRNFEDAMTFSVGVEHELRRRDDITVRGGYAFDQSAIPAETMMADLPDADKHIVSLGASWPYGDALVDLGYEIRLYEERTVTNSIYATEDPDIVGGNANGTYNETLMALVFGIRYDWR